MDKNFIAAMKLRDISGSITMGTGGTTSFSANYTHRVENNDADFRRNSNNNYFDLRAAFGEMNEEETERLMNALDTLRDLARRPVNEPENV